jgi:hypothetical protein
MRRCCMYSMSIAPESTKPPASLIRGSRRIIIDCRRRIWWNRSIVQENATRGDDQGAKKSRRSFGTRKQRAGTVSRVRYAIETGRVRAPCWCRVPIPALPRGKAFPAHLRNREPATHKFPVGAYVLHQVSVRSSKETFRITRLLPDDGAGFQYRIKGEQDGFERVVKESSLEAIGL